MRGAMLRGWLLRGAAGLFVAASGAAVTAADEGVAAPDGRLLLQRVQEAALQRNYEGTLVYSAGGTVSSTRIAHYADGGQQYERLEMLDGQMRRVYRHNDTVKTVWPALKLAVDEPRDPLLPFPALLQPGDDRLQDSYEVRLAGAERMAGHDAEVLLLKPRDRQRFGQRLWVDKQSRLLLRAEVRGLRDEVLESSSFTDVTIGVRPQPDAVLQPMRRLDGYRTVRATVAATQLEAEGWSLAAPVAGFRRVRCVKRPLESPGDPAASAGEAQVLQTVFSDGLAHVSLFVEPFDARRHTRPMQTALGATHTLTRRHGDWWITLVGEVPAATLKQFATALERRP